MKDKDKEIEELKKQLSDIKKENEKSDQIANLKGQIRKYKRTGISGFLRQGVENFKGNMSRLSKDINKSKGNSPLQNVYDNLHKSFIGDGDISFVPPGVR